MLMTWNTKKRETKKDWETAPGKRRLDLMYDPRFSYYGDIFGMINRVWLRFVLRQYDYISVNFLILKKSKFNKNYMYIHIFCNLLFPYIYTHIYILLFKNTLKCIDINFLSKSKDRKCKKKKKKSHPARSVHSAETDKLLWNLGSSQAGKWSGRNSLAVHLARLN